MKRHVWKAVLFLLVTLSGSSALAVNVAFNAGYCVYKFSPLHGGSDCWITKPCTLDKDCPTLPTKDSDPDTWKKAGFCATDVTIDCDDVTVGVKK
jgi:hypothetical protein